MPVKAVTEDTQQDASYRYLMKSTKDESTGRVEVIDVGQIRENSQGNNVTIWVNADQVTIFVDSGCKRTLIPIEQYTPKMGPIKPTSIKLRPYGTDQYLKTKGEIAVTLQCLNGAKHHTTVYIVEGHRTDALLGDWDAKALGILRIEPRGRSQLQNSASTQASGQLHEAQVAGILSNLQAAGIQVQAQKEPAQNVPQEEQHQIKQLVHRYSTVVREEGAGSGLMLDERLQKPETVDFHIDYSVKPVSAPYRPPPMAYQARLSQHLDELRAADKIEDIGPNEHCPWVSNVVITEKKQTNQIRMNVDMREPNKALLCTRRHIETIQEMRHKLKGASRFSELDLGHGYHQIALDTRSRAMSTFQTHEGLHRFKVLFFGAAPASDLFHNRVKASLEGLKGVISIHDNILVWGKTPEEHSANLESCLVCLTVPVRHHSPHMVWLDLLRIGYVS